MAKKCPTLVSISPKNPSKYSDRITFYRAPSSFLINLPNLPILAFFRFAHSLESLVGGAFQWSIKSVCSESHTKPFSRSREPKIHFKPLQTQIKKGANWMIIYDVSTARTTTAKRPQKRWEKMFKNFKMCIFCKINFQSFFEGCQKYGWKCVGFLLRFSIARVIKRFFSFFLSSCFCFASHHKCNIWRFLSLSASDNSVLLNSQANKQRENTKFWKISGNFYFIQTQKLLLLREKLQGNAIILINILYKKIIFKSVRPGVNHWWCFFYPIREFLVIFWNLSWRNQRSKQGVIQKGRKWGRHSSTEYQRAPCSSRFWGLNNISH